MTVHGDFSRGIADGYAGVLFQQGRVSLDTDGTAQTLISTAWQDTAARDAFGAGIAAVPASERDSFRVETAAPSSGGAKLAVHPGRVWADGLLVRLDGADPVERFATYLQPPVQSSAASDATIDAGVCDAVVLDVWREALSGFQLPDVLIEPALGGPDTTERLNTAFAFRLYRLDKDESCETLIGHLDDNFAAKGRLTVDLDATVEIAGPCPVIQGGGYSGFEHNLYRIEVADADVRGEPRFKWSQYNGGLVGRAHFDATATHATITANLAAITSSGLDPFYLEALALDETLGIWRVIYGAEASLDGSDGFNLGNTLSGSIPGGQTVFIRLWNGIRFISDFVGQHPTPLQDGILLNFEATTVGGYTPGDYWTFDVRAGEIPNATPLIDNQPPEGVYHHRVPLGVLNWTNATAPITAADRQIEDCRVVFDPLTRLDGCCTFRVGDGVHSHGDFTTIQAAVDALPAEGGEVCVLPGVYTESVLIAGRERIIIGGCNRRSLVQAPFARPPGPVFHVRDSRGISISGLEIRADDRGIGILVDEDFSLVGGRASGPSGTTQDINLRDLHIASAVAPAIEAHGVLGMTITDCLVEMRDVLVSTRPAIFFQGEDALIEHNLVRVKPIPQIILAPTSPLDGAALYQAYEQQTEDASFIANHASGGMQIGGLSARVRIVNNVIHGGIGTGITLGSLRLLVGTKPGDETVGVVTEPADPCPPGDTTVPPDTKSPDGDGHWISAGPLYDIYIQRNRILDMRLNGIGVIGFFVPGARFDLITVIRLTIDGNEIRRCLNRTLADPRGTMQTLIGYGGIALAHVENLLVRQNIIRDNGPNHLMPISGIFVLFGEGVEIDDNRIINNGATTADSSIHAHHGARGGIVIAMVQPPPPAGQVSSGVPTGGAAFEATPALRVHDNVVVQPLGPALFITALGPVSVHANSFASQGIAPGTLFDGSLPGATVNIRNLGLPREQLSGAKPLYAGIAMAALMGGFAEDSGTAAMVIRPSAAAASTQVLHSGIVLFSDNQVQLDIPPIDMVIFRPSTPSAPGEPSRQPAPAAAAVSTPRVDLGLSSIGILTLDDLGFHSNQCLVSIAAQDRHLYANAALFANSLRVTDNRFKEGLQDVVVSATTLGTLNTTSHNQSNHCLIVRAPDPAGMVDTPNTLLAPLGSALCRSKFASVVGNFGQIVKG